MNTASRNKPLHPMIRGQIFKKINVIKGRKRATLGARILLRGSPMARGNGLVTWRGRSPTYHLINTSNGINKYSGNTGKNYRVCFIKLIIFCLENCIKYEMLVVCVLRTRTLKFPYETFGIISRLPLQ